MAYLAKANETALASKLFPTPLDYSRCLDSTGLKDYL